MTPCARHTFKISDSHLKWLLSVVFFCVLQLTAKATTAQEYIDNGLKYYGQEQYHEAMKAFLEAEKRARDANDANVLFSALLNIGNCYLFVAEHGEAMSHYAEAFELAQREKLGWKQENYTQNCISAVYFEDGDYSKARELVERCLRLASENRDTASVITYRLNLALIANKEGRAKVADQYLKEVQQLVQLPRWKDFKTNWEIAACDADYASKRYAIFKPRARRLLDDKRVTHADKEEILLHLLNVLQLENEQDEVINLVQRSWATATYQGRRDMSQMLSAIYQQRKNWQQALRYKDSLLAYSDSVSLLANRQMMEKSKVRMQIFQARSEMESEIADLKAKRIIYVVLLIACVLVILVIIRLLFLTRERAIRNKQFMDLRLEKEKQAKLLAEEKMRETELEAHYKQQLMHQTLDQKKRELSATILFTEARNKLIEDIIEKINLHEKAPDRQTLNDLVAHLRQQLKENERDQLLVRLDTANSEFVAQMHKAHPHLSPSDVRFLSFVRMNLSNKEISSMLNITPESCKMRKIRLCKKLGFSTTQQLYDYVSGQF